ncbi:hypothetical protein [Candidatus Mycobacterium methanotrophicum]|uniref:hypothetical protein n=1 Tax=Candidatus Mycobacterium methanotrophicum TaxID=2943498 RepID=UPI0035191CAA
MTLPAALTRKPLRLNGSGMLFNPSSGVLSSGAVAAFEIPCRSGVPLGRADGTALLGADRELWTRAGDASAVITNAAAEWFGRGTDQDCAAQKRG